MRRQLEKSTQIAAASTRPLTSRHVLVERLCNRKKQNGQLLEKSYDIPIAAITSGLIPRLCSGERLCETDLTRQVTSRSFAAERLCEIEKQNGKLLDKLTRIAGTKGVTDLKPATAGTALMKGEACE
jgi:hypothetical protein